eukprot:jgi/Antlo1/1588/740
MRWTERQREQCSSIKTSNIYTFSQQGNCPFLVALAFTKAACM